MKNFIKSIPNALSYIIFPRKIATLCGMSMLLGMLLYLTCFFISMSSSSWTVEKYVTDSIGGIYYMDFTENDYEYVSGDQTLPTLKYLEDTVGKYYYAVGDTFVKDEHGNNRYIYDQKLKNKETGKITNAKFVYELEYLEVVESDEEVEIKVSNDFVGTYTFKEDASSDKNIVIDVLKTGKGYYNGKEVSCTESGNTLTCTNDEVTITIEKTGSLYEISFNDGTDPVVHYIDIPRIVNTTTLKHFDFNAYFNEKTKYDENEDDVLIIYTRNIIYYMFNRGYTLQKIKTGDSYNFITMPDQEGNLQNDIYDYYLPSDILEAKQDPSTWTKTATKDETVQYDGTTYNTHRIVSKSLTKVFGYNVPLISYNYCVTEDRYNGVLSTDPYKVLEAFDYFHVVSWGESVNLSTSCEKGLPYGILIPLICIIITWVMSKKRGNLKTFKEYFNLAAFAFIPVAIIEFIVGFFLQYSLFIYFGVLLQLGVFILYAFRINSEVKQTTVYKAATPYNQTLSVDTTEVQEENVVVTESKDEVVEELDDDKPNLIG